MRPLKPALAWLALASVLPAQTLITAGDNNVTLAQVLRFHPEGMILSLPSARGQSLGQAIETALGQEPADELQVSSLELALDQKAGIELQRLYGWSSEKPHWALVGPDRRAHAQGSATPTSAMLFEAFRQSPLHTRAEVLRNFLKLHPGQTDALARLILETRSLAELRAERLLVPKPTASVQEPPSTNSGVGPPEDAIKKPPPDGTEAGPAPVPPAPAAPTMLTDEQDAKVWDEYAALYERFMTDDHWLDMAPDGTGPVSVAAQLSDSAGRSPRLMALAQKLIPVVEERLRRRPSDEGRWQVWTSLRSALGEVRPSSVLEGLEPLPGAERWPPAAALDAFVEEAQRTGNWHEAEPVLQASYDQNLNFLHALEAAAKLDADRRTPSHPGQGGQTGAHVEMGNYFGFGGWTGEVALLLEAKLRLGKTSEADRLFQEVYARVPKRAIARSASALARTCGALSLAEKWGRLAK